jgi:hypothetical protein
MLTAVFDGNCNLNERVRYFSIKKKMPGLADVS